MKISELIAELQDKLDRHGDLEVLCTWEDTIFGEPVIYRGRRGASHPWVLLIDADCCDPNEQFEHPGDRAARLGAAGKVA